MSTKEYNLEQRTLTFSANVVRHSARLKQPVLRSITEQLIRSATSIGANYAEAINASSKLDFRNKIFIAKKEAAETKYWLMLLIELGDKTEQVKQLQVEAQALVMILQKIVNTLKNSKKIDN